MKMMSDFDCFVFENIYEKINRKKIKIKKIKNFRELKKHSFLNFGPLSSSSNDL